MHRIILGAIPQVDEQVRNIVNQFEMKKEVLSKDKVANGWNAIFMSLVNCRYGNKIVHIIHI